MRATGNKIELKPALAEFLKKNRVYRRFIRAVKAGRPDDFGFIVKMINERYGFGCISAAFVWAEEIPGEFNMDNHRFWNKLANEFELIDSKTLTAEQ